MADPVAPLLGDRVTYLGMAAAPDPPDSAVQPGHLGTVVSQYGDDGPIETEPGTWPVNVQWDGQWVQTCYPGEIEAVT